MYDEAHIQSPPIPGPRPLVLVVDDEANIGRSLARMLRRQFRVIHVSSAIEARAVLERSPDAFDLILCDVMMPETTGPELHRWLRAELPQMAERTVFMTGSATVQTPSGTLLGTARPCVLKPFTRAGLVETLTGCLAA